jgi:hypothetical protein
VTRRGKHRDEYLGSFRGVRAGLAATRGTAGA